MTSQESHIWTPKIIHCRMHKRKINVDDRPKKRRRNDVGVVAGGRAIHYIKHCGTRWFGTKIMGKIWKTSTS